MQKERAAEAAPKNTILMKKVDSWMDLEMKKFVIFRALVFLLFVSTTIVAHAEGGCPPGQYPQSGQGWQTCVPIPNAQPQQPAPATEQWSAAWGALAVDDTGKVAGSSKDQPSKAAAISAAIDDCKAYGAKGCKNMGTYANQCVAVVSGDDHSTTIVDESEDNAVKKGLSKCNADKQSDCHVFYSACSLPKKIR